MSAIRSIELAIDLALRRRDESVQHLAHAQQNQGHAINQLQQLKDYVLETDQRLLRQGSVQVSLEVLRHHYQFMARLQEAIQMQTEVVGGLERRVNFARAELAKAESAVMGLRTVLKKRLDERNQLAQRREQSLMDELAAQQHLRRVPAFASGEH
ncbi:flagellar export protein FliJ [Curvibacter sp. APW13]|uniref:flagellar export protein FliJ n=1 Tax=Curvibacter sp. APW13 TaxID=3077236 RepID=UPI0028DFC849|nr:flagellar export protein FliJ [Curvibacter sp. APW13]MDT8992906.1 flagellar export protein FliJ [Curvibacter sp. APW13]